MNKLTTDEVNYIRDKYTPYDKDFGGKALAAQFNVSRQTINNIIRKKNHHNNNIIYIRVENNNE